MEKHQQLYNIYDHREEYKTDGQTASIIKYRMLLVLFSQCQILLNSFKNELFSENVILNNFSLLIVFKFKRFFIHFFSKIFSDFLDQAAYTLWIF